MRLGIYGFILFMFWVDASNAQSTVSKKMDAQGIKELNLVLDHAFLIEVENTTNNEITFDLVSEGEFKNNLLIKTDRNEDRLRIEDELQPFSSYHNDKLSAHKVFAVVAKISVPKGIRITLKSKIGSFKATGRFASLFVELNSGDCILNSFIGDAEINTMQGDITIYMNKASVQASSKSGRINNEIELGENQLKLKTISGDINILKTK